MIKRTQKETGKKSVEKDLQNVIKLHNKEMPSQKSFIKQAKIHDAPKWVLKKSNEKPSKQTRITNQVVEMKGRRRRTQKGRRRLQEEKPKTRKRNRNRQ